MAGVGTSGVRRCLAGLVAAASLAVAGVLITGPQHASAQAVPNKSCTGPTASGAAQPGDTLSCTITAVGLLFNGDSFTVKPNAPTGSYIPVGGCTGASGGTAPANYTTTVTPSGLGTPAGGCKFTVTATTFGTAANDVIGYESLVIPAAAPSGTSVTQQVQVCSPPPPAGLPGSPVCLPFGPLPTSGTGSCIGGTALPIIGGCAPSLPTTTPTPAPTATPTGGGTTTSGGGSSAGSVQAASTNSTPFTSGPEHPLPVAATLVAVGGGLLVLLGLGGPMLVRRRRGR